MIDHKGTLATPYNFANLFSRYITLKYEVLQFLFITL